MKKLFKWIRKAGRRRHVANLSGADVVRFVLEEEDVRRALVDGLAQHQGVPIRAAILISVDRNNDVIVTTAGVSRYEYSGLLTAAMEGEIG